MVLDRVIPSSNVTHEDLRGAGQHPIHAEAKVVDYTALATISRGCREGSLTEGFDLEVTLRGTSPLPFVRCESQHIRRNDYSL